MHLQDNHSYNDILFNTKFNLIFKKKKNLDGWLLLFNAIWAYPIGFALFHFLAHLSRNVHTFSMEPFFALITTDHEAIIMWSTAYTPKAKIKKRKKERKKNCHEKE